MAASRIASLDGLRAIAIGLVLAEHGGVAFTDASSHWWAAPLINGGFGVRLFFVLSGFLITGLLIREQERYGRISLRAFYVRRILRIFPAFYLYLGTVAALAAAGWIAVSGSQILAAGTYTWNYLERWQPGGPAEGIWFLGHLWTLSLEEQFYLVWPGVIVLAGWRSARRAALLVPLAVPVLRVLLYVAFPAQRGQLGMMFHTGIDSIFIGCAFALWHEQLVVRLEKRSYMLGAALFAFIVSPILGHFFHGAYTITVGFGLDAICAGILIVNACNGGKFCDLLSWKPFCLIGTWSYSLYLWQQFFMTGYVKPWTGGFFWALTATFTCGLISHYLIEKPVLRLKRFFDRSAFLAEVIPDGGTVVVPQADLHWK